MILVIPFFTFLRYIDVTQQKSSNLFSDVAAHPLMAPLHIINSLSLLFLPPPETFSVPRCHRLFRSSVPGSFSTSSGNAVTAIIGLLLSVGNATIEVWKKGKANFEERAVRTFQNIHITLLFRNFHHRVEQAISG